jgi:hypothetical protein
MVQQSLFAYSDFCTVKDALRKSLDLKAIFNSLDGYRLFVSPHDEMALRRVIGRIAGSKAVQLEEGDIVNLIKEIRRKWVS